MPNKYLIPRLSPECFDWQKWRAGSIADLNIPCREECIKNARKIFLKHAVGFCEAEQLVCRPKNNEYAIMCLKEEVYFWFHIRKSEFEYLFKEVA